MSDTFRVEERQNIAIFNRRLQKNQNCLLLVVHKHWKDMMRSGPGGPEHWREERDLYLGRIIRTLDPKEFTFNYRSSASFPSDYIAYSHLGGVHIEKTCISFPNFRFIGFITKAPVYKGDEMGCYILEHGDEFPVETDSFICTLKREISELTKAFLEFEAKQAQEETGYVSGGS